MAVVASCPELFQDVPHVRHKLHEFLGWKKARAILVGHDNAIHAHVANRRVHSGTVRELLHLKEFPRSRVGWMLEKEISPPSLLQSAQLKAEIYVFDGFESLFLKFSSPFVIIHVQIQRLKSGKLRAARAANHQLRRCDTNLSYHLRLHLWIGQIITSPKVVGLTCGQPMLLARFDKPRW